ncbi:MAG: phage portal protein [Dehalococcoidia bacterium]|jgi:HK97 family phage portal protein
MNIFSRITAKAASLFPKVVTASLPSGSLEFLKRMGKMPDVSQDALVRKYFGWTYMCAQLSAQRFASTPLKLYASRATGQTVVKNFKAKSVGREQSAWLRKRLGKSLPQVAGAEDFEELEEHPFLDLLQNVNDNENSYEMKELTSVMLDLTGDAYWNVERDKMAVPSKLFVLRSQWVRIVPDAQKFVSEYIYGINQFGQEAVHIAPENIIHFKYPNPLDPWYGMGPVQAAAYAIESSELREKFVMATMGNMARPDLIVKYLEGELDTKERQLVEREWNSMFRGAKNAGKVKVTDYRYEIDKVGWTPSELDFNKGEDWIMKKICGAFPVPIGLVDTTQISRAPRAGMEGADLFMAQFNTLPRCTRIEEKLNEQLCPMYDGERLFVAFDNPVPKDKADQRAEDQMRLTACLTTVNEIRQRDGEEEVDWGDLPLVSGGIAPLGSQPQPSATGGDAANPAINNAKAPAPDGGGSSGGASTKPKKDETKPTETTGEAVKKALDGMSMEVDGQYVSPTLAGIPIRLVRNERGRFDRRGVGRLRASRDVVESLKHMGTWSDAFAIETSNKFIKEEDGMFSVYSHQTGKLFGKYKTRKEAEDRLAQMQRFKGSKDDGEGRWVTMHGQPVLIREGQSAEDAAKDRFGGGKKPAGETQAAATLGKIQAATNRARTASDIADAIGRTARKTGTHFDEARDDYKDAAVLHREAAKLAKESGEKDLADTHERQATNMDSLAAKFNRLHDLNK